jgi:RNA polymerase sigma factor (sigma-70 family)
MVHGVCRRVLGNCHDADDASQAAFLVLLGQAHQIVHRTSVGSWLHGVAYRTALKARAAARRRQIVEKHAAASMTPAGDQEIMWRDLQPILDEEIDRLPEKWRLPLVLCYLEGKTNAEAARQLQWPMGTVATRLAHARQRLRKRLTRRGVGLAAGSMTAFYWQQLHAGTLATRCANWNGAFSEQAKALAKGVTRTMWLNKMRKITTVVVLFAAFAAGGAIFFHRLNAADTTPSAPQAADKAGGSRQDRQQVAPEIATSKRQFEISCRVSEVGKDGEDGSLARPELRTDDGSQVSFFSGQEVPIPATLPELDSRGFVPAGVAMSITVTSCKDGRLHLDCSFTVKAPGPFEKEFVVVSGQTVRCIKLINPGETVQFDYGKDREGKGAYRASFTVHEITKRDR